MVKLLFAHLRTMHFRKIAFNGKCAKLWYFCGLLTFSKFHVELQLNQIVIRKPMDYNNLKLVRLLISMGASLHEPHAVPGIIQIRWPSIFHVYGITWGLLYKESITLFMILGQITVQICWKQSMFYYTIPVVYETLGCIIPPFLSQINSASISFADL